MCQRYYRYIAKGSLHLRLLKYFTSKRRERSNRMMSSMQVRYEVNSQDSASRIQCSVILAIVSTFASSVSEGKSDVRPCALILLWVALYCSFHPRSPSFFFSTITNLECIISQLYQISDISTYGA